MHKKILGHVYIYLKGTIFPVIHVSACIRTDEYFKKWQINKIAFHDVNQSHFNISVSIQRGQVYEHFQQIINVFINQ